MAYGPSRAMTFMPGLFDAPPRSRRCEDRPRSETAEVLDELRFRYHATNLSIVDAPEDTVSRIFRRRWRQQHGSFLDWYRQWRMSRDLAESSMSCMVNEFARELERWRQQAQGEGVSFGDPWVSGQGVTIDEARRPLQAMGPVTKVPDYLGQPAAVYARTMGGLTQPNLATRGDDWVAVMRSGPPDGGSRCAIVAGASWTGALKQLVPVSHGPAYTHIAGQGEAEETRLQDPMIWSPQAIGERMDYVRRQWAATSADIRRMGEGAVPVEWKGAFNRAHQAMLDWYNENRRSVFALTTGATADQANNYLAELRQWRSQARGHEVQFTGPEPGRPRHGLTGGLEGAVDTAQWIAAAVIVGLLLMLVLRS